MIFHIIRNGCTRRDYTVCGMSMLQFDKMNDRGYVHYGSPHDTDHDKVNCDKCLFTSLKGI